MRMVIHILVLTVVLASADQGVAQKRGLGPPPQSVIGGPPPATVIGLGRTVNPPTPPSGGIGVGISLDVETVTQPYHQSYLYRHRLFYL